MVEGSRFPDTISFNRQPSTINRQPPTSTIESRHTDIFRAAANGVFPPKALPHPSWFSYPRTGPTDDTTEPPTAGIRSTLRGCRRRCIGARRLYSGTEGVAQLDVLPQQRL